MRFIFLTSVLFFISFTITTHSQIKANSFVRVFDAQGNKIGKGKILSHDNNSLSLIKGKDSIRFELKDIGSIKTKHSVGNNVAVGAIAGTVMGLIIAIGNDVGDGFAEEAGYYVGIPFFAAIGAGIGGISVLFKDSKRFEIDGDSESWEKFRALIETEE